MKEGMDMLWNFVPCLDKVLGCFLDMLHFRIDSNIFTASLHAKTASNDSNVNMDPARTAVDKVPNVAIYP